MLVFDIEHIDLFLDEIRYRRRCRKVDLDRLVRLLDPGSLLLPSKSNMIYSVNISYWGPKVGQVGQDYTCCAVDIPSYRFIFVAKAIVVIFVSTFETLRLRGIRAQDVSIARTIAVVVYTQFCFQLIETSIGHNWSLF